MGTRRVWTSERGIAGLVLLGIVVLALTAASARTGPASGDGTSATGISAMATAMSIGPGGGGPSAEGPIASEAAPTAGSSQPTAIGSGAPCTPTDQDSFVYNPDRLQVVEACIRVSGVVAAVRNEADGDLHILLALDAPFGGLLTPANQGVELGDLVIEPVCVKGVTQLDAEAACAADPDPLDPPYPTIGEHVWMEGRYVLDLEHGGWAELHPLYRWGITAGPVPGSTPLVTPPPPTSGGLTLSFTSLTSPVSPGQFATATVKTSAGSRCSIQVVYKSGPSGASGLGSKTAGASGVVAWTWKVGSRTTAGSWPVTVSCSNAGQSKSVWKYLRVS